MNNIFQIYHNKLLIPDYVCEHIKKLNPECTYNFLCNLYRKIQFKKLL